jgi:type II secretory pathway pseudopilin PulG
MMQAQPARSRGFTLLEMLVVFASIGLMAAITVPSIARQIQERVKQAELQNVLTVMTTLPVRAMLQGQAFALKELPRDLQNDKKLPKDWMASFEPALAISAAPSCTESIMKIWHISEPERLHTYRIEARTCRMYAVQSNIDAL